MKTLLFFVSVFFCFNLAIGQTDSTTEYFNPSNLSPVKKGVSGRWGVNAGAFGGSFNGQGYYGSFLAPNYNVNLTSKLSVQAGVIFSSFSMPSSFNTEGGSRMNNVNGTFFYTQGSYKISNKVFLTGGAYTSLAKPDVPNNINPAYYNDAKGGKIGIGYNINEKTSLYFEMQYNKGNSPFNSYSSPFSHNCGNSFTGW
ncbi:MAG: hypothetical protein HY951_12575 [Bacteroidia bacterium]|nr:hypothetical protein [Bacteroidia bacterium]